MRKILDALRTILTILETVVAVQEEKKGAAPAGSLPSGVQRGSLADVGAPTDRGEEFIRPLGPDSAPAGTAGTPSSSPESRRSVRVTPPTAGR